MSQRKNQLLRVKSDTLTIGQLEAGLHAMRDCETDLGAFWSENIESFRRTLLSAIRDTSDALLSPQITPHWRAELESQLEELVGYIDLTDRYVARQPLSFGQQAQASPPASRRVH
jgi:hypothetical protein